MSSKRGAALAAAALIAVALIGANVLPSAAQEPPPPIATELLTGRAEFTDDVDLKVKAKLDGKATRGRERQRPLAHRDGEIHSAARGRVWLAHARRARDRQRRRG